MNKAKKLPLPIGSTDYRKICDQYYYVDKTLMLKDILDDGIYHAFKHFGLID